MFPYDYSANDIKTELDEHRLAMVLFNMPAGNGRRAIAAWRAIRASTRSVKASRARSTMPGHSTVGRFTSWRASGRGASERMYDTYVANVRFAAASCTAMT